MCGRYQFSAEGCRELQQIVQDIRRRAGEADTPPPVGGDVCPSALAPVLVARGEKILGTLQTWGLPGPRGGLIINARAETVTQKPMFRRSIAAQRCVIPASSFYEWDAARHKYQFALPGSPLYLAGIYNNVDGRDRFVILTTAPNASVQNIHDRMPLLLSRADIRPWLTDPGAALALLAATPPLLETNSCDGQLCMW